LELSWKRERRRWLGPLPPETERLSPPSTRTRSRVFEQASGFGLSPMVLKSVRSMNGLARWMV
jgi:hypothetical protein